MIKSEVNYEALPAGIAMDETDRALRAYLASRSAEHLAKYDSNWTDEQVTEWDGNFRSDGSLMLICCFRDVDMEEFRRVLEEHIEFRKKNGDL